MQQSILTKSRSTPVARRPVVTGGSPARKAAARLASGIETAFYKHVVTGMRNGVLAVTREGTLALINDVACETLGLADGQSQLGRPIADAFK